MPVYDRSQRVLEWESLEVPFPSKGLNLLLPQSRIPSGAAFTLDNADLFHLLLRKRWGVKNLGGAITGRPQRFGSFLDTGGNAVIYGLSTTQLASFIGGAWTSRITGLLGVATLVPAVTAFQNKLLATNGVDLPLRWDGITATGDTLTNANVCRAITNLGGRVLLGNVTVGVTRSANKIKWSDYLAENTYVGGSSGEADLIDTDDEIMAFARIRDQVAAVRKRSVWTITTAETPLYYRFERAFEGMGTISSGSVVSIPGGVLFLGPDDLYVFNGAYATPLLPREFSLRKFIEQQTTLDGLRRAVSLIYLSRGQYWLALALGGGTENTHVLVVDYVNRQVMGRFTFDWTGLGVAELSDPGTGVWNDFTDFWAAYDIPWALMVSLTQERLLGCKQGTSQPLLYDSPLNDVGAGITTTWEVPLQNMATEKIRGTDMKMVHRIQIIGESGTGAFTVELGFSHDGSSVTYTAPFTIDTTVPDWIYDPSIQTEAQWWTVRIVSAGVNVALRLASVVFWFTVTSPKPVDARVWQKKKGKPAQVA